MCVRHTVQFYGTAGVTAIAVTECEHPFLGFNILEKPTFKPLTDLCLTDHMTEWGVAIGLSHCVAYKCSRYVLWFA